MGSSIEEGPSETNAEQDFLSSIIRSAIGNSRILSAPLHIRAWRHSAADCSLYIWAEQTLLADLCIWVTRKWYCGL